LSLSFWQRKSQQSNVILCLFWGSVKASRGKEDQGKPISSRIRTHKVHTASIKARPPVLHIQAGATANVSLAVSPRDVATEDMRFASSRVLNKKLTTCCPIAEANDPAGAHVVPINMLSRGIISIHLDGSANN